MLLPALAILVGEAIHLAAIAMHLGGLRMGEDRHVLERAQLVLQHGVGSQRRVEFDQGDMGHKPRQIDRRLHARIAAADHRHALALEQGPIAMGAIGDALVAIFLFARHIHLTPARAGGEDHGL